MDCISLSLANSDQSINQSINRQFNIWPARCTTLSLGLTIAVTAAAAAAGKLQLNAVVPSVQTCIKTDNHQVIISC